VVGHPPREGKIMGVELAALELVQLQWVGSDYAYIGGGGDPVVGKPSFELVAVAPWVLLYMREQPVLEFPLIFFFLLKCRRIHRRRHGPTQVYQLQNRSGPRCGLRQTEH